MTEVSEQWLREIYAAELEKVGYLVTATRIRNGVSAVTPSYDAALAAMRVATGELLAALEKLIVGAVILDYALYSEFETRRSSPFQEGEVIRKARATVAKVKGQP